jgi:hypothetical protein
MHFFVKEVNNNVQFKKYSPMQGQSESGKGTGF